MAKIPDIFSTTMGLLQELIVDEENTKVKYAIIMFPKDSKNARYKSKNFKVECLASSVDADRKKSNDSTYSGEAVKITLLNYDIENTRDTKDTVDCPFKGFKSNNAEVKYDSTKYVIIEETKNEFRMSVTLYCDVTT